MNHRVVITGLGVVSPNGTGLRPFAASLRAGRSGIRLIEQMREFNFGCHVAGVPEVSEQLVASYFSEADRRAMNSNHLYAAIAALDAWTDAGLPRPDARDDRVDWECGAVIGTGIGGMDTIADRLIDTTRDGKVRRLGSTMVEKIMASGVSARVAGLLGLGNQVTTNSSACTTGTEAVLEGFRTIGAGRARRMLVGGCEGSSPFIWAGFDAMRVLMRKSNKDPARASRPMSASAGGFVPAAGAGILLLEDLESARARHTTIYAELLGGAANCGGQRMGGSMTAPNPSGVQRCIRAALADARTSPDEVDLINGHLTATGSDPGEIRNWAAALGRDPQRFPAITATKSMIGHALGAAGAIESVATVLMLHGGFLHPCLNCEDLHPEIQPFAASIPHELRAAPDTRVAVKAGFGFGDVNACLVLRRWNRSSDDTRGTAV